MKKNYTSKNHQIINGASVDWLQLNCRYSYPIDTIELKNHIIKLQDYQTKHFKKVYIVYNEKNMDEICTIACEPHSSIFKANMVLLKIHNKMLYQKDLWLFTLELIDSLKLVFISITRLDIAIDFHHFNGILPEKFIFKFLQQKIIKTGKAKYCVFGETNRRKKTKLSSNYLRFGSETSLVSYYLYNKSLELNQVKMKPYIIQSWQEKGLDKKKDVWRLEFSIKSNLKSAVEEETGEYICNLNSLNILLENNIFSLYKALFNKYWVFAKSIDLAKDSNLSRCKKLKLLTFDKGIIFRLSNLNDKKESNRSDKIFLKKLKEFNAEMRNSDILMNVAIAEKTNEIFHQYAHSRALSEWVKQKLN